MRSPSSSLSPTLIVKHALLSAVILVSTFYKIKPCNSFFHPSRRLTQQQPLLMAPIFSSSTSRGSIITSVSRLQAASEETEDQKAEEEEWEFEEYEVLEESDFYNSEWKVGTVWNDNLKRIDVTWCRLIAAEKQLKAIWGDGAEGKWTFDRASQFFSISKETFGGWGGKKIWACVIDDYYFMEGSVRGWSPLSPASVLGQWQAKRLGLDPEEMGVAPWFQEDDAEDEVVISDIGDVDGTAVESNSEVGQTENEEVATQELTVADGDMISSAPQTASQELIAPTRTKWSPF